MKSKPEHRRHLFAALASLLALCLFIAAMSISHSTSAGRRKEGVAVSCTRTMLGTLVTLNVVAPDGKSAEGHIAAAFDRVVYLEQCLSAHKPDSELSLLNSQAAHGPVKVSEDLFRIISASIAAHKRTRGAFDNTLKPLLDLWRRCGKEERLPTADEIAQARTLIGADRIETDATARTVRFPVEGMQVNLGGLGKGFIADEVVRLLRNRGVKGALVAMAGDIYAFGLRTDGSPWRVGIQDPRQSDSSQAVLGALYLSNQAVSTAGNYERYVVIQGRRFSHIVDPRTGLTAEDVPRVTVVGPHTLTIDIMDTALSVLGV